MNRVLYINSIRLHWSLHKLQLSVQTVSFDVCTKLTQKRLVDLNTAFVDFYVNFVIPN